MTQILINNNSILDEIQSNLKKLNYHQLDQIFSQSPKLKQFLKSKEIQMQTIIVEQPIEIIKKIQVQKYIQIIKEIQVLKVVQIVKHNQIIVQIPIQLICLYKQNNTTIQKTNIEDSHKKIQPKTNTISTQTQVLYYLPHTLTNSNQIQQSIQKNEKNILIQNQTYENKQIQQNIISQWKTDDEIMTTQNNDDTNGNTQAQKRLNQQNSYLRDLISELNNKLTIYKNCIQDFQLQRQHYIRELQQSEQKENRLQQQLKQLQQIITRSIKQNNIKQLKLQEFQNKLKKQSQQQKKQKQQTIKKQQIFHNRITQLQQINTQLMRNGDWFKLKNMGLLKQIQIKNEQIQILKKQYNERMIEYNKKQQQLIIQYNNKIKQYKQQQNQKMNKDKQFYLCTIQTYAKQNNRLQQQNYKLLTNNKQQQNNNGIIVQQLYDLLHQKQLQIQLLNNKILQLQQHNNNNKNNNKRSNKKLLQINIQQKNIKQFQTQQYLPKKTLQQQLKKQKQLRYNQQKYYKDQLKLYQKQIIQKNQKNTYLALLKYHNQNHIRQLENIIHHYQTIILPQLQKRILMHQQSYQILYQQYNNLQKCCSYRFNNIIYQDQYQNQLICSRSIPNYNVNNQKKYIQKHNKVASQQIKNPQNNNQFLISNTSHTRLLSPKSNSKPKGVQKVNKRITKKLRQMIDEGIKNKKLIYEILLKIAQKYKQNYKGTSILLSAYDIIIIFQQDYEKIEINLQFKSNLSRTNKIYQAPQVLININNFSQSSIVWTLGILLDEMLNNRIYFKNEQDIIDSMKKYYCEYRNRQQDRLLQKMLIKGSQQRISLLNVILGISLQLKKQNNKKKQKTIIKKG